MQRFTTHRLAWAADDRRANLHLAHHTTWQALGFGVAWHHHLDHTVCGSGPGEREGLEQYTLIAHQQREFLTPWRPVSGRIGQKVTSGVATGLMDLQPALDALACEVDAQREVRLARAAGAVAGSLLGGGAIAAASMAPRRRVGLGSAPTRSRALSMPVRGGLGVAAALLGAKLAGDAAERQQQLTSWQLWLTVVGLQKRQRGVSGMTSEFDSRRVFRPAEAYLGARDDEVSSLGNGPEARVGFVLAPLDAPKDAASPQASENSLAR